MIPLSDDIPTRNFPLITILAIGANIWIYFEMFFNATVPPELVFNQYGLVPYNLIHSPVTEYPAIYSSMFIHS